MWVQWSTLNWNICLDRFMMEFENATHECFSTKRFDFKWCWTKTNSCLKNRIISSQMLFWSKKSLKKLWNNQIKRFMLWRWRIVSWENRLIKWRNEKGNFNSKLKKQVELKNALPNFSLKKIKKYKNFRLSLTKKNLTFSTIST